MTLILSGTDGLSDVDGSAATPAIRGTDANTGIFFPAADTIAFSEGGVESMRLNSSGNVGIGTSTPGANVEVFSANNLELRIHKSGVAQWNIGVDTVPYASTDGPTMTFRTGGSERMRLNTTNGLSIGTSGSSSLGTNTRFTTSAGGTNGSIGSISGSGTGAIDTGISVNQGSFGGTLLLMCSTNFSDLGGTISTVFMVQLYFSGNLTPGSTVIAGSAGNYTIGRSGSNTLTITSASGGNHSYAWIGNK